MVVELHGTRRVPDRIGSRRILIIAIILMILMIDGVDLQFLSIASPLVIAQWKVDTASFGIALTAALALIEPAILIVMGIVVVFILISLYLPIFSMGQGPAGQV